MVLSHSQCVCAEDFHGSFPGSCAPCQPNSDSPVNTTNQTGCLCRLHFQPPACEVCRAGYTLSPQQPFNCTCTPGFYELEDECLACLPGHVCADGLTTQPCGGGRWGTARQQSSYALACPYPCGTCPPGQWKFACAGDFEGVCLDCPANTYGGGEGVVSECTPCPAHSDSPRNASSISDCACRANYYFTNSTCLPCPAHSDSSSGSTSIFHCVCRANYYFSNSTCQPCPAYSDSPAGSQSPSSCACRADRYAFAGECPSCPPNSESLPGSVTVAQCVCLANHYRSMDECPACPNHSTSLRASLSITACKCAADYYFTGAACSPCPRHSQSPYASLSIYDCVCLPGYLREEPYLCTPCPAGYVCPSQYSSYPCPDGAWGNVTGQHEDASACPHPCGTCPPGRWKRRCGAFNPGVCVDCPEGTYGGGAGATSVSWCQTCPVGSTSPAGSATAPSCGCNRDFYGQPGYFCWPCPQHSTGIIGATSVGDCLCLAGRYGPDTFAQCPPCPANSTSRKGARLVMDCHCEPGHYLANGTLCATCPANSTSPEGSANLSACVCEPGFYGPDGGPCAPCPHLWICPGGSVYTPYVPPRAAVGVEICCDVIVTFPGSPAVAFYPTSFFLQSVTVFYDDGSSVTLLPLNVTFAYDDTLLTETSGSFSVNDVRTYPPGLLTTVLSVVYAGAFAANVTVTIPEVTELLVQTYFPAGLDPSSRTLRRLQCSEKFQHIDVTCRARLNLPLILPVSSGCDLFVRDAAIARPMGARIEGVSPGTTSAYAEWWGYTAEIPAFHVVDDSVYFTGVVGYDYYFYGVVGEAQELRLGLVQTLANGVTTEVVPNAFASPFFAGLVQVAVPPSVQLRGHTLVSQANSREVESITFTLTDCGPLVLVYNSTLLVNLAPAPGDLDVGQLTGVAIPPTSVVLSVRINLQGVLAFHAELGCDFAVTACVPSPLWAGEAACTVFDPVGTVRLAGVNRGQSGVVEVALLFVDGAEGGLRGWVQALSPSLTLTTVIAGRWGQSSLYAPPLVPASPLLDVSGVYRANGEGLLVLVRQQRILEGSVAFGSEREVSVLVRFVDREGEPDSARLRVFYLVNSTADLPFSGWSPAPHLREGWHGVEWKAVIPFGWASFSVAVETLDDYNRSSRSRRRVYGTVEVPPFEGLNFSGAPFARFQVGAAFPACPREAQTPAAVAMSYRVRVSGNPTQGLGALANALGCELGVPLRRVELDLSGGLLSVTVRVESFLRLYEVNLFVMDEAKLGAWLSSGGLTVVTVQRRSYSHLYDPPDTPSACPEGRYYYRGAYAALPPHALPRDCYSFACERGFHEHEQWCVPDNLDDQVYWNVVALLALLVFFTGVLTLILRGVINLITARDATPVAKEEEEEEEDVLPVDVTEEGDLVFAAEVVDSVCLPCYSCGGHGVDCPCRTPPEPCSCRTQPEECCCRRPEGCHCACCWRGHQ